MLCWLCYDCFESINAEENTGLCNLHMEVFPFLYIRSMVVLLSLILVGQLLLAIRLYLSSTLQFCHHCAVAVGEKEKVLGQVCKIKT